MEQWATRPLADFVEPGRSICYGIVQPGAPVSDGVPIVRVNNFVGAGVDTTDALRVDPEIEAKYRRSRLQGGELLITLVGSMGLTAIASEELRGWNVARAVGVVPLRADADKRWINFVVRSKPAQDFIRVRANTTVQATFNLRDLAELPVPCPPDATRIEMSTTLSALDDKIELNRRMNETLEAMARAIFKDWFVDFGPTRTKMLLRGEDPKKRNAARAPYLTPDLWALFPDHLDIEGRPEGWVEQPLTQFVEIIGGGTPKTSEPAYWGGQIPWFSVVDTPSSADTFVFDTEKTITQRGLQNSSARLVETGETIISARGTVGNLARAGRPMAFNQSCYGLRGANGYGPSFVFLAAKHMVARLQSMAHGSVFSTITRQTFEAVKLCAPYGESAALFEISTASLFERIKANVSETRTLAAIRDLLLLKLMSGEVRVKDAEEIVGDAI